MRGVVGVYVETLANWVADEPSEALGTRPGRGPDSGAGDGGSTTVGAVLGPPFVVAIP